jgi:hypothetical protein
MTLFVTVTLEFVDAKKSNSEDFLTYQNLTEGFKIQYPAGWEVIGAHFPNDPVVEFHTPFPTDLSLPHNISGLEVDTHYMGITDEPINTTVKNYAQYKIDYYNDTNYRKFDPDFRQFFKLINSSEFPIAGNYGWKIEFLWGFDPPEHRYYVEIFTVANNQIYSIEYASRATDVPKTLPLANKMIESFEIIKLKP